MDPSCIAIAAGWSSSLTLPPGVVEVAGRPGGVRATQPDVRWPRGGAGAAGCPVPRGAAALRRPLPPHRPGWRWQRGGLCAALGGPRGRQEGEHWCPALPNMSGAVSLFVKIQAERQHYVLCRDIFRCHGPTSKVGGRKSNAKLSEREIFSRRRRKVRIRMLCSILVSRVAMEVDRWRAQKLSCLSERKLSNLLTKSFILQNLIFHRGKLGSCWFSDF